MEELERRREIVQNKILKAVRLAAPSDSIAQLPSQHQ